MSHAPNEAAHQSRHSALSLRERPLMSGEPTWVHILVPFTVASPPLHASRARLA